MADRELASRIIALAGRDLELRERLARSGELFEGYSASMETVHVENAGALAEIVAAHGWPGLALVGPEAAEAAWLVAQHAISTPALQRSFLDALAGAVERGDAAAWQLAYLTDRIRCNEGRPQVYGTVHDWDEDGLLSPLPTQEPDRVDELRRAVGLPPLDEATRRLRAEARSSGERAPRPAADRRAEQDRWAVRVGWRRRE